MSSTTTNVDKNIAKFFDIIKSDIHNKYPYLNFSRYKNKNDRYMIKINYADKLIFSVKLFAIFPSQAVKYIYIDECDMEKYESIIDLVIPITNDIIQNIIKFMERYTSYDFSVIS